MVAANALELFRVEIIFDHRPVAEHERVTIDGDQPLPDVMPVRVGFRVEGVDHARVRHSGFTFTSLGEERSMRMGFRSGRPKPRKLTTITSPSSSFRRSLKLNR